MLPKIASLPCPSHIHIQFIPVIDLEAFGFGGKLPDILAKAVETTRNNEPLAWQSIINDPLAKRVLENPMAAVKEVVEAAMDAADHAKLIA